MNNGLKLKSFSIILVLYLAAQGFLYSVNSRTPIIVNNKTMIVKNNITIKDALNQAGYNTGWGRLLNEHGKVILKNGGRAPRLIVNNQPSALSAQVKRDDNILFTPGADIKDTIKTRRVPIPFRSHTSGSGAFITIRRAGVPGLREEVYAVKTGRVIQSRVLRHPQDAIYLRAQSPPTKKVALTFDDGPEPPYTQQIARILKERRAPATFFVLGRQIYKYPQLLAKTAAAGFAIGSHTVNHLRLDRLTQPEIDSEYGVSRMLIIKTTGVHPHWLRPPFGKYNALVLGEMPKYGYRMALWNVDTLDWKAPSPEYIWQQFISEVKPGAVILLHDGGGDRHNTVAILPRMITYLRDNGYNIVPLDELYAK